MSFQQCHPCFQYLSIYHTRFLRDVAATHGYPVLYTKCRYAINICGMALNTNENLDSGVGLILTSTSGVDNKHRRDRATRHGNGMKELTAITTTIISQCYSSYRYIESTSLGESVVPSIACVATATYVSLHAE